MTHIKTDQYYITVFNGCISGTVLIKANVQYSAYIRFSSLSESFFAFSMLNSGRNTYYLCVSN